MGVKQNEQLPYSTYLQPSHLLDFTHPAITHLIESKGWDTIKGEYERIGDIYTFVRDEIAYGYTRSFSFPASMVLTKGYGNCLTKSTLLMALLRAVGIPCRFHATTISNVIFRGLLPNVSRKFFSKRPFHAWVEVLYENTWLTMGGHIVDRPYLLNLQAMFPDYMGSFYDYGIAVLNFKNPDNRWNKNHTYVQNKAIEKDLGLFDTPDDFFSKFPEAETYTKSFRYKTIMRKRLNKSIQKVRNRG